VLPLLKSKILLGSGADTFLYEFPQNDYAQKANMGAAFFKGLIKDAHSMYLQWMLTYGIAGTLCLCIFLGSLCIRLFRLGEREPLALGIGLGMAGYLLSGLAWTSSVSLSPVFWVLCGCGSALVKKNCTLSDTVIQ
jgi:O-antigen ligase